MLIRRLESRGGQETRFFVSLVSIGVLIAVFCQVSAKTLPLRTKLPGWALQASKLDPTTRITGTLRDINGPIKDADVYVQYFEDEKCARLFTKKNYNPYNAQEVENLKKRLQSCSRDLAPTKPDEQGRYEFRDLKPGWYAMRFLWNIFEKPKDPVSYSERNGFVVGYYATKDLQGKYDTMAQGKPVYFSGKKDLVVDYDGNSR